MERVYKNKFGRYTAIGDYINYLEMNDIIILPLFGIKADDDAYNCFSRLFPHVEVINSRDIAEFDGVLNCISCGYLI